jgi:hypothetical protein
MNDFQNMAKTLLTAENFNQRHYKSLVAFSLGQATAAQTLELLGTDSTEDLFLLMAQARLPMPRLPEAATRAMAQRLHQLPNAKQAAKTKPVPPETPTSEIAPQPDPVIAFRGSGAGGGTQRLVTDRKTEAKLTRPALRSSNPGGDPTL